MTPTSRLISRSCCGYRLDQSWLYWSLLNYASLLGLSGGCYPRLLRKFTGPCTSRVRGLGWNSLPATQAGRNLVACCGKVRCCVLSFFVADSLHGVSGLCEPFFPIPFEDTFFEPDILAVDIKYIQLGGQPTCRNSSSPVTGKPATIGST